jgi:hypothetical protein
MQTVSLPYGSMGFAMSVDPERLKALRPVDESKTSDERFLIDWPPLPELLADCRALLIVSDLTRSPGSKIYDVYWPAPDSLVNNARRFNVILVSVLGHGSGYILPFGADGRPTM